MTKLLIGARLMPIVLIVAVLLGLYIAQFHLSPVRASVPSCGSVQVSGSSWAGGAGVDVHSNGADDGTAISCGGNTSVTNLNASPPQWGLAWQCVELAARMYQTHGWAFPSGNAIDLYPNAASVGDTTMAQGSITLANIVPGDLLVTHEATYGHVMLVDSVNTSNNTISAVDQNGADGGRTTVTFNPTTKKLSDGTYYQFSGVVHSPSNTLGNPPKDPRPPSVPWSFENLVHTHATFSERER